MTSDSFSPSQFGSLATDSPRSEGAHVKDTCTDCAGEVTTTYPSGLTAYDPSAPGVRTPVLAPGLAKVYPDRSKPVTSPRLG
jgi:hypothetical protein